MRSRYAAFAMLNEPYLLATWHASRRPKSVRLDPAVKWLGLKVVAADSTGDDAGEVEFVARLRVGGGSAARLHERSRFVREAGRWFYVDGDHDPA
jgi:SEC-C motif-containing protein